MGILATHKELAMSAMKYAAMARKHWAEWLPKKTQELKDEGRWQSGTDAAGKLTEYHVQELMEQGFQRHEAEEVALKQRILLTPEPPDEDDEEERELAEMEREYQAQGRRERAMEEKWAIEDQLEAEEDHKRRMQAEGNSQA
jgi:hypothetical protein